MCRYAITYKPKFACFECRKSFRHTAEHEMRMPQVDEMGRLIASCPQCCVWMTNMGLDFKAPRQNDSEQWRKVEKLAKAGVVFSSCGCNGPGARPQRLREVDAFLEQQKRVEAMWARRHRVETQARELQAHRSKRKRAMEAKRVERQTRKSSECAL